MSTNSGKGFFAAKSKIVFCLIATFILGICLQSQAFAQTRIVVLPFYSEDGRDARDGGRATQDYRRMMRFINNQLVRHNFEVINPTAADASEREYNRIMERAREDSAMACLELCKRYSADAAYIVWLNVKIRKTADGYSKASARVDGEGYDSAGRDLGAGLSKTFKVTKRDRDDAIAEVEKEVGDLVGRKLTAWSGPRRGGRDNVVSSRPGGSGGSRGGSGGVLQRNSDRLENLISIRIDGATEYEALEAFQKILNTVTGVTEARRYSTSLQPDNPSASYAVWRIRIEDTDPFRVQANIMTMINRVLDAGGDLVLKGVHYRYSAAEVNLLMGVRPGSTTSREVQFVFDRERMRDREMQGLHDPYDAR